MQGRSYRATWHPGPVPGCAATEEACRVGAEGYSLSLDDLQECCLSNPHGDFTGGPVVKNPPCNTEDVGLIPGQGTRIPHATWWPKNKLK